ncbi:hypothetical protein BDP27DRAFT_1517378, partial [Rhodocollybia butyracea]
MVLLASAFTALASATLLNAVHVSRDEPAWMVARENSTKALGGLAAKITGQDQTFDFVVIGGGTAGITIAARLAEDPSITVALIEAGSFYEFENAPISSTPFGDVVGAGASISDADPVVDWQFMTTPQPGFANRAIHYARGRTLGGSSARNFLIYHRPTVQSLQMWADQVDDQSYTWDNFLPYMKKSVQFTTPNSKLRATNSTPQFNPAAFERSGGPLQVSYPNYAQPFSSYAEKGFNEIGIPSTEDFQSGTLMGAQYCPATIDPKQEARASSQETFLSAYSAHRTNLKVFQLTMAKKILFNSHKTATGVQVNITGLKPFNINARKEVILSAGSFQSPQLLMVSGIGPKATLEHFGIDVIVDNPNVGQNMWDHVLANPAYPIKVDSVSRMLNMSLPHIRLMPPGALTSNVADFLAWEKAPAGVRSNFSKSVLKDLEFFPSDWPEIEYIVSPGYLGNWKADYIYVSAAPDSSQPSSGNYASVCATLVAPLSRGNVTIASADASVAPIINPNFLTAPSDKALILAAYKRARQFFASASIQEVVVGTETYPGLQFATDDEIFEQITEGAMTVWHASCTCKMGSAHDATAVLNTQAQVLGVNNLRVVDSSAFPILPPGHPQSIVYALAEKIADDIKKANNLS